MLHIIVGVADDIDDDACSDRQCGPALPSDESGGDETPADKAPAFGTGNQSGPLTRDLDELIRFGGSAMLREALAAEEMFASHGGGDVGSPAFSSSGPKSGRALSSGRGNFQERNHAAVGNPRRITRSLADKLEAAVSAQHGMTDTMAAILEKDPNDMTREERHYWRLNKEPTNWTAQQLEDGTWWSPRASGLTPDSMNTGYDSGGSYYYSPASGPRSEGAPPRDHVELLAEYSSPRTRKVYKEFLAAQAEGRQVARLPRSIAPGYLKQALQMQALREREKKAKANQGNLKAIVTSGVDIRQNADSSFGSRGRHAQPSRFRPPAGGTHGSSAKALSRGEKMLAAGEQALAASKAITH